MNGFIDKIKEVWHNIKNKIHNNKIKKIEIMSSEGFKERFVDTPDEITGGKVNEIAQNKTLWIGQLTNTVSEPEFFQDAKTIKDVFERFQPEVEVEFSDEDGSVQETLKFTEMKDFEVNNGNGKLVANSEFLCRIKSNIETNAQMKKKIETERGLREVLNNTADKESLKAVLQAMLDELNEANK